MKYALLILSFLGLAQPTAGGEAASQSRFAALGLDTSLPLEDNLRALAGVSRWEGEPGRFDELWFGRTRIGGAQVTIGANASAVENISLTLEPHVDFGDQQDVVEFEERLSLSHRGVSLDCPTELLADHLACYARAYACPEPTLCHTWVLSYGYPEQSGYTWVIWSATAEKL